MSIYRYCFKPQYLQKRNPLILPAAIAAVGGLGSGLIGAYQQNKANKLNYQMFQEGNDFNERMLEKQQAFAYDLWRRENTYNAPENQVRRLLQAGLNPAALNGNSNVAGLASGAPSAGSASAASPSNAIQPVTAMSDAIGNMSSQFANLLGAMSIGKDIEAKGIDNSYKDAMNLANLEKLRSEKKVGDATVQKYQAETDRTNQEVAFADSTFNEMKVAALGNARKAIAEADALEFANHLQKEYGEKLKEQEYQNLAQEYLNLIAQGDYIKAQKVLAEKLGSRADAQNAIDWYNARTNRAESNAIIDVYRQQFKNLLQENNIKDVDEFFNSLEREILEGKHGRTAKYLAFIMHYFKDMFGGVNLGVGTGSRPRGGVR